MKLNAWHLKELERIKDECEQESAECSDPNEAQYWHDQAELVKTLIVQVS